VSVYSDGMTIWLNCASDVIIDVRRVLRQPSVRRVIRLFIVWPIPAIIYANAMCYTGTMGPIRPATAANKPATHAQI
jgi:hypothetical protein